MSTPARLCRDCPADAPHPRPAPFPGPRCATHHGQSKRMSKAKAHDAYVARTYGVSRGFYAALIEAQGGRCAICQVATGKARRLAVDHDHGTGAPRGALCGPCNRIVGAWRDDPERFRRAARYLTDPPAAAVLLADDGPRDVTRGGS